MSGIHRTKANVAVMREGAAKAGKRIYERRLKDVLEPHNRGRVVAIHIPSEDYFLGNSLLEASDLLREKYPLAARGGRVRPARRRAGADANAKDHLMLESPR